MLEIHYQNLCTKFPSFSECPISRLIESISDVAASWSRRVEDGVMRSKPLEGEGRDWGSVVGRTLESKAEPCDKTSSSDQVLEQDKSNMHKVSTESQFLQLVVMASKTSCQAQ
jgi:hypothetical protein